MSGMTGYDQAASYTQYNYVPNLQTADGGVAGAGTGGLADPRQLHVAGGGWGTPQGYAHHQNMSPGGGAGGGGGGAAHHQHRGYPYYDRNGYYVHQQHAGQTAGFDTWHEPAVTPVTPGAGGVPPPGTPVSSSGLPGRPDSPSSVTGYPSPAAVTSAANYSCKMAVPPGGVTPPSPGSAQQQSQQQAPKASAGADNPQQMQPYAGQQQTQYQCPLTQSSQAQGVYNNNMPAGAGPGGPPPSGGGGAAGIHNSYSLSSDGSAPPSGGPNGQAGGGGVVGGQHSPGQQAPPGPNGPGGQNQSQAPLPSPLYPWMRSQFGKKKRFHFLHLQAAVILSVGKIRMAYFSQPYLFSFL